MPTMPTCAQTGRIGNEKTFPFCLRGLHGLPKMCLPSTIRKAEWNVSCIMLISEHLSYSDRIGNPLPSNRRN
jgi:hypothetical protein